jgi:outer membrane protein OmpA-like peptidoglycan-associated protein
LSRRPGSRTAGIALFLAAFGGCASSPIRVPSLEEVERVRGTDAAQEGARRAPEVFARAERERELALAAHLAGDDVVAKLHAERAIAAYGHALVVARLAVAVAEQADAQRALDEATTQEQSLDVSRANLESEAGELQERARLARVRLLPAASDAASGERAAARLAAARSLAIEARLLCGAARLVAADPPGVADAEADLGKLDGDLDAARRGAKRGGGPDAGAPEPIDEAGAARARCLDVLTRVRRAAGNDGRADALLTELSASGEWSPVRDERGVVVTLRGAFRGVDLTDEGQAKLKTLGQVAAAHPGFAVQVVVHDAETHVPVDSDARRADATVKALVAAGAAAPRVKAELAGTLAPVVDPADPAYRARNERLDVVFVAGG